MATINLWDSVAQNILKMVREVNPETNITDVNSFSIVAGGVLEPPVPTTINGETVMLDTWVELRGNPYYRTKGQIIFRYKRIDVLELLPYQDTVNSTDDATTSVMGSFDSYTSSTNTHMLSRSILPTASLNPKIIIDRAISVDLRTTSGQPLRAWMANNHTVGSPLENNEGTISDGSTQNYYQNRKAFVNFVNIADVGMLDVRNFPTGSNNNGRPIVLAGENNEWFINGQPTSKFLYKNKIVLAMDSRASYIGS